MSMISPISTRSSLPKHLRLSSLQQAASSWPSKFPLTLLTFVLTFPEAFFNQRPMRLSRLLSPRYSVSTALSGSRSDVMLDICHSHSVNTK